MTEPPLELDRSMGNMGNMNICMAWRTWSPVYLSHEEKYPVKHGSHLSPRVHGSFSLVDPAALEGYYSDIACLGLRKPPR